MIHKMLHKIINVLNNDGNLKFSQILNLWKLFLVIPSK